VDFDFVTYLTKIGESFVHLKKLILQGLKQLEIEADSMEDFLQSVAENCKQLQVI
jgi:hypothetical protein